MSRPVGKQEVDGDTGTTSLQVRFYVCPANLAVRHALPTNNEIFLPSPPGSGQQGYSMACQLVLHVSKSYSVTIGLGQLVSQLACS